MKIFLDSSFFFPVINIEVKGCPKDLILDLLQNPDFDIFRSELVLFELSAKGTKYVNSGLLSIEDVTTGLNTIQLFPSISVIPIYYSEIQTLAANFREIHQDFIDCLVLASAVCFTDIFLTMDGELLRKSRNEWREEISKINHAFQVMLLRQFRSKFMSEA